MKSLITFLKQGAISSFAILLLSSLTFAQHYTQTNLVSNVPGRAPVIDPNLQNPWGLIASPTSAWWVSNNAGGTATLYTGAGQIVPINGNCGCATHGTVVVPGAPDPQAPNTPTTGSPTGVMFNGSSTDFLLAPDSPALFLFVTEDGTLSAWSPKVNPLSAIIKVDNSQKPNTKNGAVYKGAAIVEIDGKKFILAANFRSGRIDAFDSTFQPARLSEDAFDDDRIPRDFAPFNVQAIGPNVYVTYAKQDDFKHDPLGGAGLGFVDVFSSHGKLLARLQHGDWFNAPWGVVLTPADFGELSHTLLVGSFRGVLLLHSIQ
jgi:uncharacterized protein (TIGR03118 family)